ncbi:MAG: hypothetical protein RL322_1425 [Pseudomonadota bacterium]
MPVRTIKSLDKGLILGRSHRCNFDSTTQTTEYALVQTLFWRQTRCENDLSVPRQFDRGMPRYPVGITPPINQIPPSIAQQLPESGATVEVVDDDQAPVRLDLKRRMEASSPVIEANLEVVRAHSVRQGNRRRVAPDPAPIRTGQPVGVMGTDPMKRRVEDLDQGISDRDGVGHRNRIAQGLTHRPEQMRFPAAGRSPEVEDAASEYGRSDCLDLLGAQHALGELVLPAGQ